MCRMLILICLIFITCTDEKTGSKIPEEAPHKEKIIFIPQIPDDFTSGIAWLQVVHNDFIATDSKVEVDWLQFYVVVNGEHNILCEDQYDTWDQNNQGGLYIRYPWFPPGDFHEPMQVQVNNSTIAFLPSNRKDRVWHWWCSKRLIMPREYDYIYLKIKIRLEGGACFQAGFDWHKSQTSIPEWDVTVKEIAVSDWYFAASDWQIITFESR